MEQLHKQAAAKRSVDTKRLTNKRAQRPCPDPPIGPGSHARTDRSKDVRRPNIMASVLPNINAADGFYKYEATRNGPHEIPDKSS